MRVESANIAAQTDVNRPPHSSVCRRRQP
jgi:hypothetical protein